MTCFITVFGLAVCVFEELMVYSVCVTFLERRLEYKYQDFLAVAGFSLTLFLINQFHCSPLNVAATIVISLAIALLLFTGFIREKLYCCSLACLVLLTTEYVGFRLLGGDVPRHSLLSTVIATVLIKLTAFFILQIICHGAKNKKVHFAGSRTVAWCFFLYPLSCFILLLGLRYSRIEITARSAGEEILIAGLLLLLFSNMLLFFLYDHIVSMSEQMREYELNRTKDTLAQQHFAAIQETNNRYASLLHDVNNYIRTIQTMQLMENSVQIQHTSRSLMAEISDISRETFCASPIINAILLEKSRQARQAQIDFDIFVEPFFPIPSISDNDLISLLCNLIDNAMEAAAQCDKRFVDIKLFVSKSRQIIKIRNSCKQKPRHSQNRFFTSKPDTLNHGFGIQRVEAIVKKYHGILSCTPEDSEFTAVVALPPGTDL